MGRGGYNGGSHAVQEKIKEPKPKDSDTSLFDHSTCGGCGQHFELHSQLIRHKREGCNRELQPDQGSTWTDSTEIPGTTFSNRDNEGETDCRASSSTSDVAPATSPEGDVVINIPASPASSPLSAYTSTSEDSILPPPSQLNQSGVFASHLSPSEDPIQQENPAVSSVNLERLEDTGDSSPPPDNQALPDAYLSLIKKYGARINQGRDSQYRRFCNTICHQTKEDEHRCRASVIEFHSHGSKEINFRNSDELEKYLCNPRGVAAPETACSRRLFILEDLCRRHVCLLGSHLRIHPSVFANQYTFETASPHSNSLRAFPSSDQDTPDGMTYASSVGSNSSFGAEKRRFALRYPMILPQLSASHHPDPKKCPEWLRPLEWLQTDQNAYPRFNVDRGMETPSCNGKWDFAGKAATLEAQVTFWSRVSGDDWDAMMLVDPCIKDPVILGMLRGEADPPYLQDVVMYPDFDDYLDIPQDPAMWGPKLPWTTFVLYEDMLQHFALSESDPGSTPLALTSFMRGFAINKWIAYLNHACSASLALRNRLFAPGHTTTSQGLRYSSKWGGKWEEWMFERMVAFAMDLSQYHADLECNMRELGIDVDDPQSYGVVGKREAQMWRYIRDKLESTQADYKDLAEMYTKVLSLRESQMSNYLNRSVGRLTLMGACFVPASLIASLLSMGDTYLPGKKDFWVYWVITIPIVILVSVMLYTGARPGVQGSWWTKNIKSTCGKGGTS